MNKTAFFCIIASVVLVTGVGCSSTAITGEGTDTSLTRPADGVTAPTNLQEVQATIIIDSFGEFIEYPIAVSTGGSVIDGMNVAEEELALEFTTITDPALGEYVDSIAGIESDQNGFWAMYVNGESSTVGASTYVLQEGDIITWSYEEIRP